MSAIDATVQCALGHTMRTGPSDTHICVVCRDPATQETVSAMHCVKCTVRVCEKCTVAYKDVGFAVFLSEKKRDILPVYERNSDSAKILYRDPWSALVYYLYQEFNNTAVYHESLGKQIKRAEESVQTLKAKLAGERNCLELECSPHHVLGLGKSTECRNFCAVCTFLDRDKPAFAMHCLACGEHICVKCLPRFQDVRLVFFLNQKDRYSLFEYEEHPEYITPVAGENQPARKVYELYQDFNKTPEHFEILKEKIATTEKRIVVMKLTLAEAFMRSL